MRDEHRQKLWTAQRKKKGRKTRGSKGNVLRRTLMSSLTGFMVRFSRSRAREARSLIATQFCTRRAGREGGGAVVANKTKRSNRRSGVVILMPVVVWWSGGGPGHCGQSDSRDVHDLGVEECWTRPAYVVGLRRPPPCLTTVCFRPHEVGHDVGVLTGTPS